MTDLTKHQLACLGILASLELSPGKGYRSDLKGGIPARTIEVIAMEIGVSNGYIKLARKLLKQDPEYFWRVLDGLEPLPYARGKRKTVQDSFALYRAYDDNADLLYVGITFSLGERMPSHAVNSEWWDLLSYLIVDRNFSTREELVASEEMAIVNENPRFNRNTKGR